MLAFRTYTASDRAACLCIFDSNCPDFMHPDERAEFEGWLAHHEGTYLVLEDEGAVMGCGGFVVEQDEPRLTLTWGLVHRAQHGRRRGELLLLERLVRGAEAGGATHSQLGTAPLTEAFFERVGFRRTGLAPDGWAPGLDRVDMRLELDEATVSDLRRRLAALRDRFGSVLRCN